MQILILDSRYLSAWAGRKSRGRGRVQARFSGSGTLMISNGRGELYV
jgi:hypothetical protein